MTMNSKVENNRDKVRRLLRELFQFDAEDLDFGIYRILNFRRKEIERFIEKDLIEAVEGEFREYAKAGVIELQREVERLRTEINRDFGEGTIDEQGRVMKHRDAPKVQDYVKKTEALSSAEVSEAQMNEVFNHIYEFFSRYYDKGDFISKRRFGGKEKYHIPYSGEEVVLHWVNKDQYYVKTDEYFRNYHFKAGAYRVNFLIREAEVEVNNVVGENKYFALGDVDAVKVDDEKKTVDVYFEYRALSDEERRKFGKRNVQETLVADAKNRIFSEVSGNHVGTEFRVKVDEERTILEKHLNDYVRRNSTDYFVHKNLRTFLEWELEFYIKNEIVDLDELENLDERRLRIARAKVKAIRGISGKIIEFLAQIEDFQKMLFEKKKFIIGTEYVITLDRIEKHAGEDFLESIVEEILSNSRQLEEWKQLFDIEVRSKKDFIEKQTLQGKDWKRLPLDTGFFEMSFKTKLLEKLTEKDNLNEILDGILIKSENYQALNLLKYLFQGKIDSIYIDPPYNTGNDEFLYKDNYLHSSWSSMINDRICLASSFLTRKGTIGISIDTNEIAALMYLLLSNGFEKKNIITVKRSSVSGPKVINPGVVNIVDYLLIYAKDSSSWEPNRVYREKPRDKRYNNYVLNKNDPFSKWEITTLLEAFRRSRSISESEYREARKNRKLELEQELSRFAIENADSVVQLVYLDDSKISKDAQALKRKSQENPGKIFHLKRERYEDYYMLNGKLLLFYSNSLVKIGDRYVSGELISDIWTDVLPNDLHNEGGVTLRKGKKPEKLIGRFIELTTSKGQTVLDFFVGSGTTCAAAHKLGRKWICVEFASYFEDLALVRMKNVLSGEQSGISKQVEWRGGGLFKYHYVEQYEDTLNNIVFREKDKTIQETLESFQDYFLHYMLDYETKDSSTRLSIEHFQTPFNYKIWVTSSGEKKLVTVDLIETFNYLFGTNAEKFRTFKDNDREYRVVLGKKEEENIAIIWRKTKDIDLRRDKEFTENTILAGTKPDRIFINGDSLVEKAEPIEPEFKRLMGA